MKMTVVSACLETTQELFTRFTVKQIDNTSTTTHQLIPFTCRAEKRDYHFASRLSFLYICITLSLTRSFSVQEWAKKFLRFNKVHEIKEVYPNPDNSKCFAWEALSPPAFP